MKRILAVVLILIVLSLGAIYLYKTKQQMSNQPSSSSGVQVNNAKLQQSSASTKYQIDISYPQLSGMTNPQIQEQVNQAIKNYMQQQADSFIKDVSDNPPNPNLPANLQNAVSELTITAQVAQASNNFVSVQFEVMDSQPGMAHPNNYNLVFNYDVKNNKQLNLADLFNPGSNYLQTLSDLAKADLQNQMKDQPNIVDFINQGASPTAENFKLFTLSPTGLNIIFNPATVAPDYVGTKVVTVPFSQLKSVLNPSVMNQ
jgi:hypothetical protein